MLLTDNIGEKELTRRISRSDRAAFDIVFRRYYPGLVIFASRLILDRTAAEEIVQDFFVKLWEKRLELVFTDSMKSYFFTSIRNGCFNYLKHKKTEQEVIGKLKALSRQSLLFEPDVYVASELQEKITRAVNALPERCREVFFLSRFRGMKNDQIAQELGLSKRTVETHISNAISALRRDLREYADLLILAWFLS